MKRARSYFTPQRVLYLLATVCVLAYAVALPAGPTVIRDSRIHDTALTPALGRGYSIGTNTFQSLCMDGVVRTTPSYNFYYRFEEMEADGKTTSKQKFKASGGGGNSFGGLNITMSGSVGRESEETSEFKAHRILVTIEIESYYASVNEAQTKLSESARALLTNQDIPGFFDSCGIYYVRSLGRTSKFISMFEYQSKSSSRDKKFEAELETSIKGWGQEANAKIEGSSSLSQSASEKNLTITTVAYGLGKNEEATLISYDIDTFKTAVKDAFLTMQNDDVGLVTTMEVVPWIENTSFQEAIGLEKRTRKRETLESMTGQTDEKEYDTQDLPLYEKKRILNLNGEMLAEIDRVSRAKMNNYYKARLCRADIVGNYTDGESPDLTDDYADKYLLNNRTGRTKPLKEFYEEKLSLEYVQKLQDDYQSFLYGSGSDGGALRCASEIMQKGIFITKHFEIDSCKKIQSELLAVLPKDIDDFCMPYIMDEPRGPRADANE